MSDPSQNDPDNPEWTEADFARARPASAVLPVWAAEHLVRSTDEATLRLALEQQGGWARGWKLAA